MRNLSKIKKFLVLLFVGMFLFGNLSVVALAATEGDYNEATPPSVLPSAGAMTTEKCQKVMSYVNAHVDEIRQQIADRIITIVIEGVGVLDDVGVLGCGIKTGDIPLWMVPFFMRYILEFIIGIAGLICVGGIVYGGFVYMFAGIGEDKTKGKKAIEYGIIGMVMSMLAWAAVNIVIAIFTI